MKPENKVRKFQTDSIKKCEGTKGGGTYAEISCGVFTTLRKRLAFAAASSRLVAAVEPLGFFGRLPNRLVPALRFLPPP